MTDTSVTSDSGMYISMEGIEAPFTFEAEGLKR